MTSFNKCCMACLCVACMLSLGCTWLASGLLVHLRAGLVAPSLVCWLKQNKRHRREGSRGPEQGRRPRFSQCRHGSMPKLSELHGYGATSLHSRSQGYGEREEGKEVQSWGFPTGVAAEKGGDHGRPWLEASELAGISARATRGIGEAWVR